jgi:hypothetical protein
MWPFKKRALTVKELPVDGPWSVSEGKHNGNPMFVRTNVGYRGLPGVAGYDHQVGIAVPLNHPDPSGFPSPDEGEDLSAIEDMVCRLLDAENESLFVASITTSGMRELVYYTRDPKKVKLKFERVRDSISTHRIQLMIQLDKNWDVYSRLN